MMLLPRILPVFLIFFSPTAFARIGETSLQFIDRYGVPRDTPTSKIMDKNSPLLEGAIHHTYEYQGWKIRAAFLQLDGPAVRVDYSKLGPNIVIKDYELEAIMKANTPAGVTWKKIAYNNPDAPNKMPNKLFESYFGEALGQKMWQRSDGPILWCRGNLIVRLELPIARENEAKLKAEKEEAKHAYSPALNLAIKFGGRTSGPRSS
jgi:hypothetical protein